MAVTKIHPIKKTLYSAIKYITSNEKTDEQKLIHSKNCIDKFAHTQFENTRKVHKVKGTVLAHHLIQSFLPDEVDIDTAHKIGRKLCDEILGSDYEYVLTTHIDKGHIHNHIIFNNVSYTTGKCYQSNKKSYYKIRYESDKICKENNLIVIDKYYSEYIKKFKKEKTSTNYYDVKKMNTFKSKLKYSIDKAILQANSYEHFLKIMRNNDYEVKYGKHIAFKHSTQNKFTRSKSINENYTEESIKNRIEDSCKDYKHYLESSLIDIENNVKAHNSKAYELWARKHNLKTMAASIVYMRKNNLTESKINHYLEKNTNYLRNLAYEIKSYSNNIKNLSYALECMYIRDNYTLRDQVYHNNFKFKNAVAFLKKNNYEDTSYRDVIIQLELIQKKRDILIDKHLFYKNKIRKYSLLGKKITCNTKQSI